jgi:hypothetical protein
MLSRSLWNPLQVRRAYKILDLDTLLAVPLVVDLLRELSSDVLNVLGNSVVFAFCSTTRSLFPVPCIAILCVCCVIVPASCSHQNQRNKLTL